MDYYKNLDLADIKYFCEFEKIWKIEEWRDVVGYEGKYHVSDLGRIKSLNYRRTKTEKILKSYLSKSGYLVLALHKNSILKSYQVHQLVAIAFLNHIPCGFKLVINHKNFTRTDNQKLNLEIITNRENTKKIHLTTTSKYLGVYWHKKSKKWLSRIRIGKNHKYLGIFEIEEDASKAYNDMLLEINRK